MTRFSAGSRSSAPAHLAQIQGVGGNGGSQPRRSARGGCAAGCRADPVAASDHPPRRGCGDGLARDRLVSAALAHRAVLPHPQTTRAATGGQPAGKRRAADQADRDRRPRRLHHHATRLRRATASPHNRANIAFSPPEIETLHALLPEVEGRRPRSRRSSRIRREIARLGRMDHRQARRGGRLSQIQTARPNHLPGTASNTSNPSPTDGGSEKCACPRANAGTHMWTAPVPQEVFMV